jgi:hypothetical protein
MKATSLTLSKRKKEKWYKPRVVYYSKGIAALPVQLEGLAPKSRRCRGSLVYSASLQGEKAAEALRWDKFSKALRRKNA